MGDRGNLFRRGVRFQIYNDSIGGLESVTGLLGCGLLFEKWVGLKPVFSMGSHPLSFEGCSRVPLILG